MFHTLFYRFLPKNLNLKFEDVFLHVSVSTSFPRHHLCVEGGGEKNIETKTKEQKSEF
jgi:hypothetical protein